MLRHNLEEIKEQATILSEAYRLRLLGRLWWANMALVVLPAALATAAAVCAAGKVGDTVKLAAWLAGAAAVLTAVHKALQCEEYQSECLRLSQSYKSLAILADAALSTEGNAGPPLLSPQELATKFADLAETAKAPLPDIYIRRADNEYRKRTSSGADHTRVRGQGATS